MSAEDLEIHQPADTSVKEYIPLKGSLSDGLDRLLQRGQGILRGSSLPSLVDVSSRLNEDENIAASPEEDFNTSNHKGYEKTMIKVVVEPYE